MKRFLIYSFIGALVFCVSCSTVTIRPKGTAKTASEPTWSSSESFFFWGLVGEHRIDVSKVCGSKGVKQMQTENTFVDGLLNVITLGIYTPRSAKVWCN